MTKKYFLCTTLALALAVLLGFSSLGVAITMGSDDGFLHASWTPVAIDSAYQNNKLPSNPYFVVSANVSGDFIAVAADTAGGLSHFYLLDHLHFNEGWKQTGTFITGSVDALTVSIYGIIFAFGIDSTSNTSVVATSYDQGKTWSQSTISGAPAHYNSVAFSVDPSQLTDPLTGNLIHDGVGVATGKDGAVAITGRFSRLTQTGITWTQNQAPTGLPKIVAWSPLNATQNVFVLTDPTSYRYGYLIPDTCVSAPNSLTSTDGTTWTPAQQYFSTSTFPTPVPIYNQKQVLCYNGIAYVAFNVFTGTGSSFPCANLTALFSGLSSYSVAEETPIADTDFQCSISNFYSSSYLFMGVGVDKKDNTPVSVVSQLLSVNGYCNFSVESLPQQFIGLAEGGLALQKDASGQFIHNPDGSYKTEGENRLVAIGSDGTSYFTPTAISSPSN